MSAKTMLDRLADKFTVGDDCWDWHASMRSGYGVVRDGFGRGAPLRPAALMLYEIMVGPLPEGTTELDHLCRNRACVRPDHVEPVTRSENIRRSEAARTPEQRSARVRKAWATRRAAS